MTTIFTYILYFFFYSSAGWLFESTYCSIGEKRIINRGFLIGPMCPIYGTGTLVMELLLYIPFRDKPLLVLLLGMVFCDIVEYLTSFIMEKLFNARWWDYKNELLNLNGRICIKHTIIWGIGSLGFVKFIHPRVEAMFARLSPKAVIIAVAVILFVFVCDLTFAVIKATDILKLMRKMNEFRETVEQNADEIKQVIGEKHDSLLVFLGEKVDEITAYLDEKNSIIDNARDEVILSAQIKIHRFEDKIRRKKHYSDYQAGYPKHIKRFVKENKAKFKSSTANLIEQIKNLTEEFKNMID